MGKKKTLAELVDAIRNPGGGMKLVSHGWVDKTPISDPNDELVEVAAKAEKEADDRWWHRHDGVVADRDTFNQDLRHKDRLRLQAVVTALRARLQPDRPETSTEVTP